MKTFAVSSSCLILLSAFSGAVSAQNAAGIVQNADESTRTIYTAPVAGLPIRLTDGLFVYAAAQVGRSEAGVPLWKRLAYVAITRAATRLHWVTRYRLGRPKGELSVADLRKGPAALALEAE
jgi:CelD/BcsL family acetyltransferase involved in cellulose biosynthesis